MWDRDTKSNVFGTCHNRDVETDPVIDWFTGTNIPENILIPRVFLCDKWLPPEDYPFVIGPEFLVSQRIANIFDELELPIIYYDALLIQPNGHTITGYKVAIVTTSIECVNIERSRYYTIGPTGTEMYAFFTVVLDEKRIPKDILIFRLKENWACLIVHERVKKRLEEEKITGVDFVPLELV